jgi:hypothetical protein
MYGCELPVTDVSKPNKQIYQKCLAITPTRTMRRKIKNVTLVSRRKGRETYGIPYG